MMKKILMILFVNMIFTSCVTSKLIKKFDAIYIYKVYNNINFQFYYTNNIQINDCYISFIDHEGDEVVISQGHYSYVKIN